MLSIVRSGASQASTTANSHNWFQRGPLTTDSAAASTAWSGKATKTWAEVHGLTTRARGRSQTREGLPGLGLLAREPTRRQLTSRVTAGHRLLNGALR